MLRGFAVVSSRLGSDRGAAGSGSTASGAISIIVSPVMCTLRAAVARFGGMIAPEGK